MPNFGDDTRPDDFVLEYHERTKHHTFRYAAGPGYLDWESQPNPFRRYADAPLVRLPLPPADNSLQYRTLYLPDAVPSAGLDLRSISRFLRYALSLTAWKQHESTRWALRANPSSGNLHPTEGYLVLPAIVGLNDRAAVYHYAPREHGLERRVEFDDVVLRQLLGRFPQSSFLVGLSSIHWREAWKYGERAYRYCQHDVGHAVGALRFAAAANGWGMQLLDRIPDATIANLLGLDRDGDYGDAEREHPDLLAVVTTGQSQVDRPHPPLDNTALQAVVAATWCGRANTLSETHNADWPVIDAVADAAEHRFVADAATDDPATEDATTQDWRSFPTRTALSLNKEPSLGGHSAERVILGRRSALAMDGTTAISRECFYRMLTRLMPVVDNTALPWDTIPWRPRVHLALFVHRVNDLEPGVYAMPRDPDKVELLRAAMSKEFSWERPPSCPAGLPLFLLRAKDVRHLAAQVSCGQNIAGDGAFSLGMLAELSDGIARFGPSFYRRLFWEAGLIGQVLYLEAEESGIRSTGIGCYFDDHMHNVFGIIDRDIQSLYHFTVGTPVEDRRLSSHPAYPSGAAGD